MSITGSIKKREYKRDGKVIRTRYRARYLDPAKPGANAKIEQTFRREADAKEWLVHQAATIQEGTHIDPREATTPLRKVVEDWRGTWDNVGALLDGGC